MMPLTAAPLNRGLVVKKVLTDERTRRHLENLGILSGAAVTCLSENAGNLILRVKEGRLALNRETAGKIMV